MSRGMIGYNPTGRRWSAELEISDLKAPAENFKLDPTLPILGQDPKFPTDLIVIPKGRLLGVAAKVITSGTGAALDTSTSEDHKTILTLADGVTYSPIGYAGFTMHSQWYADRMQALPAVFKQKLIALPYVASSTGFSNGAYGDLTQGDKITAYAGKGSTSTIDPRHKGKVVKWVEKSRYTVHTGTATTSTGIRLASATFSPFTPTNVVGWTADGVPTSATVAWQSNAQGWVATFATSGVKSYSYTWGQGIQQIAGTILGLEIIDSDLPGWLKWVRDNYGVWDLPRMQMPGWCTAAAVTTGDTLTDLGNGAFQIAVGGPSHQIAAYKEIVVQIGDGCLYLDGDTGTWTAASGVTSLPRFSNMYLTDYSIGKNYSVNPITGILQLWGVAQADGTAIEASDITMSYYYEDIDTGVRYDSGQMMLTDAFYSGLSTGTPTAYDIAGSVGIMKIMVD
jgi:hypothetical protein